MKNIGIVVCNFNKREYVIKCLEYIFASDTDDFDVYVVDNASTDDSVEYIKKEFGDRLTLIENKENLGGSGGFNTGLRIVYDKGYPYLMCVDNDAFMEPKTIRTLYDFLEKNHDVGMAGSKICAMGDPTQITTYGAVIDFEEYGIKDLFRGYRDDDSIPDVQYCDYVPACSLMIRRSAVEKVGIMPEDNFIYWDDMEWGYKFKLAGYKVAAISASKVVHQGGQALNPTTFQKYYMFRNRLNFFMKYLKEDQYERFVQSILEELYRSICGCYLKQEYNMIHGFMFAYDDALHGVRGVADKSKILPRIAPNRFKEIIGADTKVAILFDGNYRGLMTLRGTLLGTISVDNITIIDDGDKYGDELEAQHKDIEIVTSLEAAKRKDYDVLFQLCEHVFKVKDRVENAICVDQWKNILVSDEDFMFARNFEANQKLFVMSQEKVFMECMKRNKNEEFFKCFTKEN